MPNIRHINELPTHNEDGDLIEVAVSNSRGIIHRVDKLKAVFTTEEEAIARIREIAKDGKQFFILPYKNYGL